jgi:DnaJ-class molecular chaperone
VRFDSEINSSHTLILSPPPLLCKVNEDTTRPAFRAEITKGSAKILYMECPECKGKGTVQKLKFDNKGPSKTENEMCAKCGGHGTVKKIKLPTGRATGRR